MAETKNPFGNLIKISGNHRTEYENLKKTTGNLIFADIYTAADGIHEKYIYANGIEYAIADSTDLDALIAQVSNIDASVSDISTWKSNLSFGAKNNILSIDGVTGSVTIESGDDYIDVSTSDNTIKISLTGIATEYSAAANADTSIASVKYVKDAIAGIGSALVLKGNSTDLSALLAKTSGVSEDEKGSVYIVSEAGSITYGDKTATVEVGDQVIIMEVSNGQVSDITICERNLDGAVTAADVLASDKIVVGAGSQGVKTVDYSIGGTTLTGAANTLATEEAVQAAINAKTMTADSSTADLFDISVTAEQVISAGVKTATLADISNGTTTGLALAEDVYQELTAVEETVSTAINTMSDKIGLDEYFEFNWLDEDGAALLPPDTTIVDGVKAALKGITDISGSVVTSIGGQDGAITLQAASETPGDINISISEDGELSAVIVGLGTYITEELKKIKINNHSIDESFYLNGTDISVGGDDTVWNGKTIAQAITDLSNGIDNAGTIKSITGENVSNDAATSKNEDFVEVSTGEIDENGNISITSKVVIADAPDVSTELTSATATGLATDAYVKNSITNAFAWTIIED